MPPLPPPTLAELVLFLTYGPAALTRVYRERALMFVTWPQAVQR